MRTTRQVHCFTLLCAVTIASACGGDDGDSTADELAAIAIASSGHEAGSTPVLTVTHMFGPRGARVGNILPGRYVAKGTYNLAQSGISGPAVVELTFLGTYTSTPGTASKQDDVVPSTPPTGAFEVMVVVDSWVSGPGNPRVCIYPGNQVGGSSIDCVRVF